MANKPVVKSGTKTDPDPLWAIVGTLGDTTWRMFTPSIGFTLLGVWADGQFGTKPWLMFAGVALGFISAGLLVWRQYQQVAVRKEASRD